ncbi:MAG: SCO family protein [Erythrobacter sp.]|jgi:protein SCO1/2
MPRLKSLALAAPLAVLLMLPACGGNAPAGPPPLEGARIGGDFTLTSEDGRQVDWRDFDGKYRTIYFGYAFCPDVCPTDNQRLGAGLKLFERAHPALGARLQPLFVSVDPARDTPAVLKEFTANFHPRLIGLTGDEKALQEVAGKFAASFSRGEDSPGGGYLMNHTNITLLFGPRGEPLATLPTDQGPEAVAAELEKWVR